MEEGELKKQMRKKLLGHLTDSGETTETEANQLFQEIIDEAKKEFPMTEQQIRILSGMVYPSDEGSIGTIDVSKIAQWFLKQFGGE